MEDSLARLESLLFEEKSLFEMLLGCLKEQKEALVSNNIEQIDKMVESTKEVVWRLRHVHSERERLVADMSQTGTSGLSPVIGCAAPEQQQRMNSIIDEMKVLIDGVRRVNSSNIMLSASGLEYLSKCVEILLGQRDELVMYSNGRERGDGPVTAHFVDHSA